MLNLRTEFTVLIAVYYKDDPRLLRNSFKSIYENSCKPTKVILVQDGPIGEELSQVISTFKNRDDFFIVSIPVNKGLSNALNTGIQYVTTPYIIRADADDYNLPFRFEKLINTLDSGYDLVGGAIKEVDKTGKLLAIRKVPTSEHEIRRYVKIRNPFNHMTVAYRTSIVKKLGGYPNIFLKEDYALWASFLSSGARVINLDEILVYATAGSEMYKRRGGLRYAFSEFEIQKFLVNKGLQSILGAIFIGFARFSIFLLPSLLRGFIYDKFLRKSL